MKKPVLKVGKTYEIRYKGYHGDDAYNGTGIFTGETNDIDGPVFGMKLLHSDETCWFPLEDIFEYEKE